MTNALCSILVTQTCDAWVPWPDVCGILLAGYRMSRLAGLSIWSAAACAGVFKQDWFGAILWGGFLSQEGQASDGHWCCRLYSWRSPRGGLMSCCLCPVPLLTSVLWSALNHDWWHAWLAKDWRGESCDLWSAQVEVLRSLSAWVFPRHPKYLTPCTARTHLVLPHDTMPTYNIAQKPLPLPNQSHDVSHACLFSTLFSLIKTQWCTCTWNCPVKSCSVMCMHPVSWQLRV